MKKYVDMLTIGNLSPNVLTALATLRLKYNIVSCRNEATAELIKPLSKLILRQSADSVFINDELVDISYIEDYLENTAKKIDLSNQEYYYTVAVNKQNIDNLSNVLKSILFVNNANTTKATCIVVVPKSEYATVDELPENAQTLLDVWCDRIVFLQSDYSYDYCRLIPAVKYMKENDLDDKILIQVDADHGEYDMRAQLKLARLLDETDECVVTSAASPDTLFDTPVISNELTAVKPCFFNELLWKGLRPIVIVNSPANYWHTFSLWTADTSRTTYYTKFYGIKIGASAAHIKAKSFYNELARLGINKLLTDEI